MNLAGSTNWGPDRHRDRVRADYTVSVTGSGAQTVVASILAARAGPWGMSRRLDQYRQPGDLQRHRHPPVQRHHVRDGEDGGTALVTVTRTNGGSRAISVDYSTGDGTAHSGDYTPTTGTLHWADGDAEPKTFTVPILDDGANEGKEFIALTLNTPTNEAILGPRATADLAILPSDGQGPGTFTDTDGDLVTVKLTPKTGAGSLLVFLTDPDGDGKGPIELIQLNGPTTKSAVRVAVQTPKGGASTGPVGLGARHQGT